MASDLITLLSPNSLILFIIVFTRLTGMMASAPLFSTYPIPTKDDGLCDGAARLILEKSKDMNSFLMGCGLGQSESVKKAVKELIKNIKIPTVDPRKERDRLWGFLMLHAWNEFGNWCILLLL